MSDNQIRIRRGKPPDQKPRYEFRLEVGGGRTSVQIFQLDSGGILDMCDVLDMAGSDANAMHNLRKYAQLWWKYRGPADMFDDLWEEALMRYERRRRA